MRPSVCRGPVLIRAAGKVPALLIRSKTPPSPCTAELVSVWGSQRAPRDDSVGATLSPFQHHSFSSDQAPPPPLRSRVGTNSLLRSRRETVCLSEMGNSLPWPQAKHVKQGEDRNASVHR